MDLAVERAVDSRSYKRTASHGIVTLRRSDFESVPPTLTRRVRTAPTSCGTTAAAGRRDADAAATHDADAEAEADDGALVDAATRRHPQRAIACIDASEISLSPNCQR